jgi:hypothetical protein
MEAAMASFIHGETAMSKVKFIFVSLLAVTTLAAPALARTHVTKQDTMREAQMQWGPLQSESTGCVAAPRVGAFATQPWTDGNVACEPGTGY